MLAFIGLPVAVIFIATAVIILLNVKQSISQMKTDEIVDKSQAASYQISQYFSKYEEIANQMSVNTQFENLFEKTAPGTKITSATGFAEVKKTMDNVKQSDPDNIVVSWVADIDSSQLTQSDGYTTGADWVVTERPWYKEMMQKQKLIITEPYQDTQTKDTIVSVVAPVYETGTKKLLGVTGIDFSLSGLHKMVQGYKLGKSGFYILATEGGSLIYHPDQSLNNKNVSESKMSQNIIDAITKRTAGAITYSAMNHTNYGYIASVGNTGWTITTGMPEQEMNETYESNKNVLVLFFVLALFILLFLINLVSVSIIKPLKKLTGSAQQIADGNLDVLMEIKSKDETGLVSKALSKTVDRLSKYIDYIEEISSVLNQIAMGDLNFELKNDYTGEFSKIKDSLMNIRTTLSKTIADISASAEQVAVGSTEVSNASQALAQGATEQASSIEELSATITDIAERTNHNASNAAEASQLAGEAFSEVENGNEKVRNLVSAMSDISNSSSEISKIIKTIEDIAFQTNILALNAAVEAARAGAAGKGFAVVADEVRNLAGKSAEAAKNTTALIENSVSSVENGTAAAGEAEQALQKIIEKVSKASELIEEISAATNEQATSINQVTLGLDQVSAVVQTNSATSEESAASSEVLNQQAQTLKTLVGRFKV